jgi:RHS repeat-associated protein
MTFDDNGNLATLADATGTTTYTWDSRNRLTGLIGPTTSAQFAYDSHGRRAQKTLAGVTTQFHYDGLDVIRELGGTGEASYLRTLTIDEALVRTASGDPAYVLADGLGSTVALADSTGATPTTYTYAPFGETSTSGVASPNPFRFTGREEDGSGLYYYRARYYDPIRSRFFSEDPLGLATGEWTPYVYTGNRPTRFGDALGLAPGDWWDPRSYLSWSISITAPGGEGVVMYPGGVEQKSHSPLTLVGVSLDIAIGSAPPVSETAYERGVGLGKHLGIGIIESEPEPCGKKKYAALVFHLGPGVGSPVFTTKYDPVWGRVKLPPNTSLSWNARANQ